MNIFNKIVTTIFVLFTLNIFAANALSQFASPSCFEVKYFDFFDLDKIEQINWSDKEIDEL